LSRKEEFDLVLKSPDSRVTRGALRAFVRQNAIAHARIGVIVGRRLCPQAVGRNRVKRLARESFRLRADQLGRIDVVVQLIAPPNGNEATDLIAIWDRLAARSLADAPSS